MKDLVRKRIKIKGVRQILGDSDSTIHRKTKDGRLPCPHFIGRDRYWFVDEVLEAIEAQVTTDPEAIEGFELGRGNNHKSSEGRKLELS